MMMMMTNNINTHIDTTRATIELVVSLNNEGVNLLCNRNLEDARHIFYRAIEQMRTLLTTSSTTTTTTKTCLPQQHQEHKTQLQQTGSKPCGKTPSAARTLADSATRDESYSVPSSSSSPSMYVDHHDGDWSRPEDRSSSSQERDRSPSISSDSQQKEPGNFSRHCPQAHHQQPKEESCKYRKAGSSSTKRSAEVSRSSSRTGGATTHKQQQKPHRDKPYYVFLRPILLSQDSITQLHQYIDPPLGQLCICLLFNLAVTNHSKALVFASFSSSTAATISTPPFGRIRTNKRKAPGDNHNKEDHHHHHHYCYQDGNAMLAAALDEAINLYRIAYSFQVNELVEVSRVHTLGIVNNLGQLYHQIGRDAESKACFDVLEQMISAGDQARLIQTAWRMGQDLWTSSSSSSSSSLLLDENDPYLELFQDNIFIALVGQNNRNVRSPAA